MTSGLWRREYFKALNASCRPKYTTDIETGLTDCIYLVVARVTSISLSLSNIALDWCK